MPRGGSTITFYGGCPLDPRFEHTIFWNNKTEQSAYFETLRATHINVGDFTYLPKEKAVNVPLALSALEPTVVNDEGDQTKAVNYLSIETWGEPERYYFITDKEYVSPNVTKLHLELDVMQTYQHLWEIPACFVEREHVADDTTGKHLLDEGLEVGEYITNAYNMTPGLNNLCIVVQSSVTMQNPMGEPVVGTAYGGVYSGYKLYTRTLNELGVTVLNAAISALTTKGVVDGIASMWVFPKALIGADWTKEEEEVMLEVIGGTSKGFEVPLPVAIDGYTPRNKKLYCYPYQFIYAHNNLGENAIYRYELFTGDVPSFLIRGSCMNDATVRMNPLNYRKYAEDTESGLSLTGFPTCAWTQDAYKIWLAQNSHTQALTIQTGNIAVAAGGAMTAAGAVQAILPGGDGGGQMMASGVQQMYSGYQQVAGVLAARADKQIQPPQAKGAQSGSLNIAAGVNTYTVSNMSITADYAARIDEYFDMYGYKVNRVKVPEYSNRPLWNYIKTIGCNVLGNIDAADRRRIGAIFDKGITFWKGGFNMYHYELAASNVAQGKG